MKRQTSSYKSVTAENIVALRINGTVAGGATPVSESSGIETGLNGTGTQLVEDSATVTLLSQVWQRVGDVVCVSGEFNLDALTPGTLNFNVALPVASNFTAATDARGLVMSNDLTLVVTGTITADSVGDTLAFQISHTLDDDEGGASYSVAYLVK